MIVAKATTAIAISATVRRKSAFSNNARFAA
jgi:hypothetical protein